MCVQVKQRAPSSFETNDVTDEIRRLQQRSQSCNAAQRGTDGSVVSRSVPAVAWRSFCAISRSFFFFFVCVKIFLAAQLRTPSVSFCAATSVHWVCQLKLRDSIKVKRVKSNSIATGGMLPAAET